MRQVPSFLVIGDGALASHFLVYLKGLNIDHVQWARRSSDLPQLKLLFENSTHALVLISDDAIETVTKQLYQWSNQSPLNQIIIHCSGSLHIPFAWGVHPLQSFGRHVSYSFADYQNIPFVVDLDAPEWSVLMPGFSNRHYRIAAQDRPFYHAMCALANNVTTMIWQQVHQRMSDRFGLSAEVLRPILQQTFSNIIKNPTALPSGPWVRSDALTLERNQKALADDSLSLIWNAVTEFYQRGESNEKHS
jgi:hypothetical protein